MTSRDLETNRQGGGKGSETEQLYEDHKKREQSDEEEKVRVEAKRLAESQGLKWKDLPKQKRQEFKRQVKGSKKGESFGSRPGA
jgi:hypothetical protein